MADKRTPMEDVLKRAFDANLRYWETVNRAASDYVQAMTKVWKDAPISWTPGTSGAARSAPAAAPPPEPRFMPALLLEGPAGREARAVVMVRNDLDREVEAPVVPSLFTGPDGEELDLQVRAEPARVRVAPGGQVAVTLAVEVGDRLSEGAGYRGEVNVPGLSDRGVPVVVRRREEASGDGAKKASAEKAPAKKAPAKKASAKKASAKKASAKKTSAKKASAKKASAKKTSAKKASAKKTSGKKSSPKKS